MTRVVLVSLAWMALQAAFAQPPQQPQTPASVPQDPKQLATLDGKVTHASSGEPLKKAKVTLTSRGGTSYTATTEADGLFHFTNVQPGTYSLRAERPGYLAGTYGSRRQYSAGMPLKVSAGQMMTALIIPLNPLITLTGRVLDADGDPVPQVYVMMLREAYQQGRKQFFGMSGVMTDANGEFKLSNFAPGRYYLHARMMRFNGSTTETRTADGKVNPFEEDYVSTFYPSAHDVDSATPIEVTASTAPAPMDIHLLKSRVYRVSGKLLNGGTADQIRQLQLAMQKGGSTNGFVLNAGGTVKPDGTFQLAGVEPGDYLLTVIRNGNFQPIARVPMPVGDRNVDDIVVTIPPPALIRGRIQFTGLPDGSAVPDMTSARPSLSLTPDGPMSTVPSAKVEPDGTFVFDSLPPFKYELYASATVSGTSAYLKAVQLSGQDLPNGAIDLSNGGSTEVVVLLSLDGGTVTGTVKVPTGEAALSTNSASLGGEARQSATPAAPAQIVGANVVFLPEVPAGQPVPWRRVRVTVVDSAGQIKAAAIPPGSYTVYAFEDPEPGAWLDSEWLKPWLGAGIRVTVTANSTQQVTPTLITAAEQAEAKAKRGR